MDKQNTYADLAVFCIRCNKILTVPDDVDITINGQHHTACCKACNGYIKHLSQNKPMGYTLPYGKYKGEAFLDVARRDKGYITWLMNSEKAGQKIKDACELALMLVKNEQK